MFGKKQTTYWHKHLILTVSQGGELVMIWVCSAATVPGPLENIESITNSSLKYSGQMLSHLSDR